MLSRTLQRQILESLAAAYPQSVKFAELPGSNDAASANVAYLEEHGLCKSSVSTAMNGATRRGPSSITMRGLDYLSADGGLSAELGIVTVRLHADTIRELIAAKIDSAPLSSSEKSSLKQHLESLSETALTAATTDLVKLGLDHAPNVLGWLGRFVGL